ncbi:phosphate ABC transporter permease PstA [Anaeromicropila populeti]|uniref:Phosphate transport system permease protein PstA n=1 Tax=Anaeromicropila populeti TaxID=37658 RepID=A0A1I6J9M1_9FIRM|nr:phosphate ABC transporter permease PstA [Anaeromicropila populeti]SFR75677.1 phosphate transport system permease protein [Anaeromicropila populeti]
MKKDGILYACVYLSAAFTVSILVFIIGFILYKGLGNLNLSFLTNMWEDKTTFVVVSENEGIDEETISEGLNSWEIKSLGIVIEMNEEGNAVIKQIAKNSPFKKARNLQNNLYPLKKSDLITKVGSTRIEDMSLSEAVSAISQEFAASSEAIRVKAVRPGGGILPMCVTTFYMIFLSIGISAPIGILSAVYLNEYAKAGRLLRIIRFAIQNLAGIPSIIYGLFGMMFFVQILKMQYSVLAGAMTIAIILLPTIISTTEEALKAIPNTYRESSLGLGATKLQTIFKVILPNAIQGILVAVILSIGRVVGESAALILTAGTVAQIPTALTGTSAGGSTLTVKLYWIIKETGDLSAACSIAIIIIGIIILLNIGSKLITRHFLIKK